MDVDVEVEVEVEPMLMLKEMEGRTRISLLDTEIEKLSRRNAYRQVISALTKTIVHSFFFVFNNDDIKGGKKISSYFLAASD